MPREITARYRDPLDHIWESACARLGLRLRRDPGAYASTDGQGTLSVAPPGELDPDDCLAQIALHEICHSLVEGEEAARRPDWGLVCDESSPAYDAAREHACLRTQAALLRRHGLRRLLAPTTRFRAFYDRLPADALAPLPDGSTDPTGPVVSPDPSIGLAREALGRAARGPYDAVLLEALSATAAIHRVTWGQRRIPSPRSSPLPSLWETAPPAMLHPIGWPLHEDGADGTSNRLTCATCAWHVRTGNTSRCRRAAVKGPSRIDPLWPACVLHEGPVSCQDCGACCRHAYDLVPLGLREPIRRLHPHLVEMDGPSAHLRRDPSGRRCAALQGPLDGPFNCVIYADRPRTCRDFPKGGATCLEARRRIGLSL